MGVGKNGAENENKTKNGAKRVCEIDIIESINNFSLPIYKIVNINYFSGVRAVDSDGNTSNAVGGVRNGARVYIRYAQVTADDHFGSRQSAHTDVPELSRSVSVVVGRKFRRPAHVGHRIRGDRPVVQHRRRPRFQSKAVCVRPTESTRPPSTPSTTPSPTHHGHVPARSSHTLV